VIAKCWALSARKQVLELWFDIYKCSTLAEPKHKLIWKDLQSDINHGRYDTELSSGQDFRSCACTLTGMQKLNEEVSMTEQAADKSAKRDEKTQTKAREKLA
jgi:hypothetical protein